MEKFEDEKLNKEAEEHVEAFADGALNDVSGLSPAPYDDTAIGDRAFAEEDIPTFTPVAARSVIVPDLTDEQLIKESKINYYRTQLAFALFGIAFSYLFGIGIIFSLIALIGSARLKGKVKSSAIKWAFYLSVVGLIVNVLTIAAYIAFGILGPVDPNPPEQSESASLIMAMIAL